MRKALYVLMALCVVLNGCGAHEQGHDHEHEEAHEHSHDGHIEISPERQEVLGIRVEEAAAGAFSEVIRTSGQIVSSAGDEMTVVAKSEGVVSLGRLGEGSPVSKGARIATISSRGVGSGDKLAKARITLETTRKEYERDLQLRENNIVSESHLDQSRLAYEHARVEYEALAAGSAEGDGIVVSSPLSGFVKSLSVRSGDYVETGTPIATVSSNRKLWLRADVSEKYYGRIASVRDADFVTSYGDQVYSLGELGGRLLSYGRASDGDFYIPVIFEFDNRGNLVPGSYVDVYLKTSTSAHCISVPLEAVVEDQGVHYVFVREEDDEDCFEKREVTLGQSDGRRVPILQGLQEGELVVVSGAVHVKLAGVAAVPAGHTHNH
ncbi:MAG: efflux RND transporter periplasmic adaptor subunit [Bacteroidales bacterium]|nr:efflux RND transporter periplasmic adaptor subunit [Bacteroidales bacterium]